VLEDLEKDAEKFPSKDDPEGKRMVPIIFERSHDGKTRFGGDYTFCEKAKKKGYSIYIDPEMRLEHYGSKAWSGKYGTFLRREYGNGLQVPFNLVKQGKETIDIIIDMVELWGNPYYQASFEFVYKCILEARLSKGNIVECGSGLTTLVMGLCTENKVYSLEHDPVWASKMNAEIKKYGLDNVEIIYAPLKDKWYDVKSIPDCELVVCDGPPRKMSDRNILKQYLTKDVRVLFDDYEELNGWGEEIEIFGSSRTSAIFNYKENHETIPQSII
jgi:hypothetical protein